MADLNTSSEVIVKARREGDTIFVAIRGEIDLHNSPGLRTDLLDALNRLYEGRERAQAGAGARS